MLTRGSSRPWISTSSCHLDGLSSSGVSRKCLMKALSASSLSVLVIMSPPLRTVTLGSLATSSILFSFLVNSSRKGQPWILKSLSPGNFLSFSTSCQLSIFVVETLRLFRPVGILSMSSGWGSNPIGHSAKLRNCKLNRIWFSFSSQPKQGGWINLPWTFWQKIQWHWVKVTDRIAGKKYVSEVLVL